MTVRSRLMAIQLTTGKKKLSSPDLILLAAEIVAPTPVHPINWPQTSYCLCRCPMLVVLHSWMTNFVMLMKRIVVQIFVKLDGRAVLPLNSSRVCRRSMIGGTEWSPTHLLTPALTKWKPKQSRLATLILTAKWNMTPPSCVACSSASQMCANAQKGNVGQLADGLRALRILLPCIRRRCRCMITLLLSTTWAMFQSWGALMASFI